MAIHDDNWTKEMPNMYTYSKRERWTAGIMALGVLLGMALPFFPRLYAILEWPLIVSVVTMALATIFYFLRIAFTGR
jgi:sterol desaturase/sphingolipid hydroxylase (fatty acid hydroxylase superfamily)